MGRGSVTSGLAWGLPPAGLTLAGAGGWPGVVGLDRSGDPGIVTALVLWRAATAGPGRSRCSMRVTTAILGLTPRTVVF